MALLQHWVSVGVLCGLVGVGLTGISARLRRKLLRNSCPMDMGLGVSYLAILRKRSACRYSQLPSFKPDVVWSFEGGAEFEPLCDKLCHARTTGCLLFAVPRPITPSKTNILAHPDYLVYCEFRFYQVLNACLRRSSSVLCRP